MKNTSAQELDSAICSYLRIMRVVPFAMLCSRFSSVHRADVEASIRRLANAHLAVEKNTTVRVGSSLRELRMVNSFSIH